MPTVRDTKVVIAALLFRGETAAVHQSMTTGRIIPLVSPAILNEYTRVLSYPKLGLTDSEFSAWAGAGLMLLLQVPNFVMTGVGEEALYRGVYHEELSTRVGEWPAKLIDATWFTLSHFPQQWSRLKAMPFGQLALKTGSLSRRAASRTPPASPSTSEPCRSV